MKNSGGGLSAGAKTKVFPTTKGKKIGLHSTHFISTRSNLQFNIFHDVITSPWRMALGETMFSLRIKILNVE